MKSQYNIEELASKLMENARNKKDMIVDTSNIEAITNGDVKLHFKEKKVV